MAVSRCNVWPRASEFRSYVAIQESVARARALTFLLGFAVRWELKCGIMHRTSLLLMLSAIELRGVAEPNSSGPHLNGHLTIRDGATES